MPRLKTWCLWNQFVVSIIEFLSESTKHANDAQLKLVVPVK